MKRLLIILAALLISTIDVCPAFGQDIFENENITTYYSNTNFVNVRKEPSTESNILGQLLYNTSVEVIYICDDNWACIGTEDGVAYVCADYLSNTEMPKNKYSEMDLYTLAHVLAGECQGLPDIEQLRVGSVVLNRVNNSEYPDTVYDVVFQRGQYTCTRDGNYYREPTEANWDNAKWLLEYGSILPVNVVYQSRRMQGKGVYLDSGYHYYCY